MSDATLHPMGTETTSGNTGGVEGNNLYSGMFVNVSAVTGNNSPTLTVQLQESPNNTDWYNVSGAINTQAITTTGLFPILPSSPQYIADFMQVMWVIDGGENSSFTFSVDVETIPG